MKKQTREQVLKDLRIKYRTKWLNQALELNKNKTNAQIFVSEHPEIWQDIDNGKDITDYSDSEGGEVIVNN